MKIAGWILLSILVPIAWLFLGMLVPFMLVYGHSVARAEEQAPLDGLAGLDSAANESCLKRGLSLRSITVVYGEAGKPVSASVGCGGPRRTSA